MSSYPPKGRPERDDRVRVGMPDTFAAAWEKHSEANAHIPWCYPTLSRATEGNPEPEDDDGIVGYPV